MSFVAKQYILSVITRRANVCVFEPEWVTRSTRATVSSTLLEIIVSRTMFSKSLFNGILYLVGHSRFAVLSGFRVAARR
jgi:hypothetical protein